MNFTHKTWVKLSTFLLPKVEKDKGAGFVEYGAILIFVALIAALVMGSGVAQDISQGISRAVRDTLGAGE